MVNETSNPTTSLNASNTVPKQVLDLVDVANSVNNLSHYYKRQLELDTLTTSPIQVFSNIKINGVLVHGKQDTNAELSMMPLNIFDQLNLKLKGELNLNPCNDVRVIGYSKQSVKIVVDKVVVTCSHADKTKQCVFYVADLNDMKILLGLTFCKALNLVKILCDDDCICKKVSVDILNEFPAGLDVLNQNQMDHAYLPPVNTGMKLRPDCKAHVMELIHELFNGLGTMKDAIVKLDVDNSITPVVQPPRKIPHVMIDPLKQEIE